MADSNVSSLNGDRVGGMTKTEKAEVELVLQEYGYDSLEYFLHLNGHICVERFARRFGMKPYDFFCTNGRAERMEYFTLRK